LQLANFYLLVGMEAGPDLTSSSSAAFDFLVRRLAPDLLTLLEIFLPADFDGRLLADLEVLFLADLGFRLLDDFELRLLDDFELRLLDDFELRLLDDFELRLEDLDLRLGIFLLGLSTSVEGAAEESPSSSSALAFLPRPTFELLLVVRLLTALEPFLFPAFDLDLLFDAEFRLLTCLEPLPLGFPFLEFPVTPFLVVGAESSSEDAGRSLSLLPSSSSALVFLRRLGTALARLGRLFVGFPLALGSARR